MPIWECKQLWHACHKDLGSKMSHGWSFTPRSPSYYKVYHWSWCNSICYGYTRTQRWTPLVRGGFKIPFKVSVSMCGTCLNLLLLEKYKPLSEELYIEPKEEIVLVSFLTSVQEPERQNANSKKSRKMEGKNRNPISNHHPEMILEITLEFMSCSSK